MLTSLSSGSSMVGDWDKIIVLPSPNDGVRSFRE
jgi:hypothetical protein